MNPTPQQLSVGDRVVVVAGPNTGSVGHVTHLPDSGSDDDRITVQRLTGNHVRAAVDAIRRVPERGREGEVLHAARPSSTSAQYQRLSADLGREAHAATLAAIDHERIAELRAAQQQAQDRIDGAEQRHDADTADLRRQLAEADERLAAATADDRAAVEQAEQQVLATVAAGLGVDVDNLDVGSWPCDSPVGWCIYAKDDCDGICLVCGDPDERD